jgi:hypothetical protein
MTEQTGGRGAAVNTTPIMNILGSDGTLRLVVEEGTEGAKLREYETSDGKKGSKWELTFKSLAGKITNMQMFEGDYGKNLLVTFAYEGGEDTISFNTTSPYGEDFMKKLPNINLDEFVTITPYSFVDDNGKTRKGVTVTQGDVKLTNYFYDAEKKKNLHKYPTPEGDTGAFDKDDWKIYFTQCRKFLVKYVEETFLPAYAHMAPSVTGASVAYPEDDAKADAF